MIEVLRTKRLDARLLSMDKLDNYNGRPPELISLDITEDRVMEIAGRLSKGAGLGGMESVSL